MSYWTYAHMSMNAHARMSAVTPAHQSVHVPMHMSKYMSKHMPKHMSKHMSKRMSIDIPCSREVVPSSSLACAPEIAAPAQSPSTTRTCVWALLNSHGREDMGGHY